MTARLIAALLLAVMLGALPALAQDKYPSKPVRLIVPFSAGGPTDIVARVVGARMAENLGQQVLVDNRSGAGGKIGSEAAAKSAPDGYTIVLATVSTHSVNPGLYKTIPYDPVKDFAAIGLVGDIPLLLSVHKDVPAKSVKELVAYVRANPGKFSFGSPGLGSMGHLCSSSMMAQVGNMDLAHVPYRGGGQMMNDLVAGQVLMVFEGTPTSLPQIQAGAIRPLAAGSVRRTPALPDLPTMREQGFADFECSAWFGLFGPAGLPAPVVGRLNAALRAALADQAVTTRLREVGVEPAKDASPGRLAEFLKADLAKWAPVIRSTGVQLD